VVRDHEQRPDDVAPTLPEGPWVVWCQDDNGNRFEVARWESRADTDAQAEMMERRGHRQTYWVARAE
jgi:hypothetical protein